MRTTKVMLIMACIVSLAVALYAEAPKAPAPAPVAPAPAKPPANPLADALTEELHRAYTVVADLRVALRMQGQTIQTLARRNDQLEGQVTDLKAKCDALEKQLSAVNQPGDAAKVEANTKSLPPGATVEPNVPKGQSK